MNKQKKYKGFENYNPKQSFTWTLFFIFVMVYMVFALYYPHKLPKYHQALLSIMPFLSRLIADIIFKKK